MTFPMWRRWGEGLSSDQEVEKGDRSWHFRSGFPSVTRTALWEKS